MAEKEQVQTSVRLPRALWMRVQHWAVDEHTTCGAIVVAALEQWFGAIEEDAAQAAAQAGRQAAIPTVGGDGPAAATTIGQPWPPPGGALYPLVSTTVRVFDGQTEREGMIVPGVPAPWPDPATDRFVTSVDKTQERGGAAEAGMDITTDHDKGQGTRDVEMTADRTPGPLIGDPQEPPDVPQHDPAGEPPDEDEEQDPTPGTSDEVPTEYEVEVDPESQGAPGDDTDQRTRWSR